jgi:hypothetical protein
VSVSVRKYVFQQFKTCVIGEKPKRTGSLPPGAAAICAFVIVGAITTTFFNVAAYVELARFVLERRAFLVVKIDIGCAARAYPLSPRVAALYP